MPNDRASGASPSDVVWVGLAAPLVLAALALGCGVGWLRGGSEALVVTMAFVVVLLPPVGLAIGWPGPRRLAMSGLASGAWSAVLLVVFPLYFPGERAAALDQGVQTIGGWFDWSAPAVGERLDGWLPAARGLARTPEPPATDRDPELRDPTDERVTPPATAPAPVSPPPTSDEVILPYEGTGSSLVVPVGFEHDGEELDVSMIFDTGASFTSVDSNTLRRLGVRVPSDAPEVNVRTANGERVMKLVLVDTVWLGGFGVNGVTVAVCDACAHEEEVGLLGLNVSGRFLVTVDQQTRELRLRARNDPDRLADVRYWVHPSAKATAWPDGRVEVEVTLENNSGRVVHDAVVRIGCDDGYEVPIVEVAPGEIGESQVSLRPGADCEGYTVELVAARWG